MSICTEAHIRDVGLRLRDFDVWGAFGLGVILFALWLATRRSRLEESPSSAIHWSAVCLPLSIICGIIGFVDWFAPINSRWRWDLSAFPAALVIAHGFALFRLRRPRLPPGNLASSNRKTERDDAMAAVLRRSISRHFGIVTLLLRYGVPAFFIAWFTIGLSNALLRELARSFDSLGCVVDPIHGPTEIPWPLPAMVGAAYGLAGAYCQVLLSLGYRTFRNDVSPGAAMWCAITLAVGPIVAGVFGMFWDSSQSTPGADETARHFHIALFFVAGFSPRYAIGLLEGLVKTGWKFTHRPDVHRSRALPVTQLRGVTIDVAERLSEEGITSVTGMALADPVRLLRNTRYDKRQIVGWIDCALLMDAMPRQWEDLEGVGLCNATEIAGLTSEPPNPERIAEFAKLIKVEPIVLQVASEALSVHPQVRLLRIMNELEFGTGGDEDFDGDAPI